MRPMFERHAARECHKEYFSNRIWATSVMVLRLRKLRRLREDVVRVQCCAVSISGRSFPRVEEANRRFRQKRSLVVVLTWIARVKDHPLCPSSFDPHRAQFRFNVRQLILLRGALRDRRDDPAWQCCTGIPSYTKHTFTRVCGPLPGSVELSGRSAAPDTDRQCT